jgi:hypothetical protein
LAFGVESFRKGRNYAAENKNFEHYQTGFHCLPFHAHTSVGTMFPILDLATTCTPNSQQDCNISDLYFNWTSTYIKVSSNAVYSASLLSK